jgi:gluconolactonase
MAELDNCRASVLEPGAKVKRVAGGFSFAEGPSADAHGSVYFTDQRNDRILLFRTNGTLSTFMEPCGRSNGLCVDPVGRLLTCTDERNELWLIDVLTKQVTILVQGYEGKS